MKIVEHSSTNLTFRDPALNILVGRLISGVFLIVGCLGLFLLILSNSFPPLESMIFITVFLTVGIMGVFFLPRNTVSFDKRLGTLIIKSEKLFGNKVREYPLSDITHVTVERIKKSKSTTYAIAVRIDSYSQTIRLSNLVFMRFQKAEERVNLIQSFLNMPG